VGDETGAPASKGYLYYKRPGDPQGAINVFGTHFYNNLKMSLDVSEVWNASNGAIVVTQTIRLYSGDTVVKTSNNSFQLVNSLVFSDPDYTWPGDVDIKGADWVGYYTARPLAG
jgi:hypothetical protein